MKQKFSKFKAEYQKTNPLNSPQRINPELYRKFLFETYEVDGSSESVQKAIENNGNLKVKFYDELDYNRLRGGTITHTSTYTSPWPAGTSGYGRGTTVTTDIISFEAHNNPLR